ncbi:MAG: hypothetical protein PVJ72_04410 [Gammaproteobacteria bacterium]|jgi:hypothetical protein
MHYSLRVLLILGVLLISACSSDSGPGSDPVPDSGSDDSPKNLSFQLLDSTEQPVSGVTVIMHGADNVSIEETRVSDVDGVADFGEVDNRKVTITVYSPFTTGYAYLATYVDIDPGETTLYVEVDHEQPSCFYTFYEAFDENGSISMNYLITVGGASGGGASTPFLGAGGTTCADVQNDGNISAIAFKNSPSIYGMSIDQAPFWDAQNVDEARMSILLQYEPASLTFSGLGAQITYFRLSAIHKGVKYPINNPDKTGPSSIAYADQFPAEYYIVNTSFGGSGRTMVMDALYSHIDVPLVDIQFFDYGYNTAENLVYWNHSGTTEVNLQTLYIQTGQSSGVQLWYVHLPSSSTQWKMPDLPADVLNAIGGRNNIPYDIRIRGWNIENENYDTAVLVNNRQRFRGVVTHSSAYADRAIPVPRP